MTDETPQESLRPSRFDVTDVVAVLGLVLLSAGAGMIYLPLGLVVPGAALIAVAWINAGRR